MNEELKLEIESDSEESRLITTIHYLIILVNQLKLRWVDQIVHSTLQGLRDSPKIMAEIGHAIKEVVTTKRNY